MSSKLECFEVEIWWSESVLLKLELFRNKIGVCSHRTSNILGIAEARCGSCMHGVLAGWTQVLQESQAEELRIRAGVCLNVKQYFRWIDILYGRGNSLSESLRVRMRREVGEGVMVVVHCRPTSERVDGASFMGVVPWGFQMWLEKTLSSPVADPALGWEVH